LAFSAYKKNVTLTILGEHMGLYLLYGPSAYLPLPALRPSLPVAGLLIWPIKGRLFYFYIFQKHFFTEIYFQYHNLQLCTPTARQGGGRGPAAHQRGGRDLYVN